MACTVGRAFVCDGVVSGSWDGERVWAGKACGFGVGRIGNGGWGILPTALLWRATWFSTESGMIKAC